MSDEREQAALVIFRDACELPRNERAAFLDAACGNDPGLRAHVESMLAWDDTEDATVHGGEATHAVRAALADLVRQAEHAQPDSEPIPATIGGYRVVRVVAHGGMGVVYEAEQENPVRRVAVKVARSRGTTSEGAKRFLLEAQLLARLRHPGIAQIIEAGTTGPAEDTQPFFVMEFVDGRPLGEYADAHLLSAREKLELMVPVCAAVAFAHAQGVTHRDLKPDNVLVEQGGTPKVLDFGVAKVEEAGGFGALTLRTVAGRILGTMGYMAPEQLAGKADGVGPAADVYSLGVMIYELLTGRLPHDLEAATITRALVIVTTTDAPPLSVVRPEFRGDIDALVAKALEKDPRHRYPDAAALQSDLERHLRGEPILARPVGPLRRVTKWGRRNPALATAVCGLFLALMAVAAVLLVKNREVQSALDEFELLADSKRLERAQRQAEKLWPAREERVGDIERWIREYAPFADPERMQRYEAALASLLSRAIAMDGEQPVFAEDLLQLRYDVLAKLVADLDVFNSDTGLFARMHQLLQLTRRIRVLTVADRAADWSAAIERIRKNPRYSGLELEPQVGLIPLGPDPDSGLEEFLHYETHEGAIPPAGHGARDTLGFDGNSPWPETGLIFVLIPGGVALIGAQGKDEDGENYDPDWIFSDSPVHEVTIESFFLSKFEMTQSQWRRSTGDDPSYLKGPVRPVNMVDQQRCTEILPRLGLVLPDDEHWEFAARGGPGPKPVWWTGDDVHTLEGKENVFDKTAEEENPNIIPRWGEVAPFDDPKKHRRFENHEGALADVGTYAANAFGLFDIGGNVSEWCSNGIPQYGIFFRGGNYRESPWLSRTAFRYVTSKKFANQATGLRPAMTIASRRPR